jgi:RNA polymerase sigma-70 factor (ECF subfamily)
MEEARRAEFEHEIRGACETGDFSTAVTRALKSYGPELFGFLVVSLRDETIAGDTFAELAEALWKGLPNFAWECSLRTWTYAVARNIVRTNRRNAARRERRGVRASDSALDDLVQGVRTETLAFLQTEKRTRLQTLRDSLPEEDRMLLVLRVDRKLAWTDLVRVMGDGGPPEQAALARESARLRKRFQLVKERLRDLARKEGLIV